jgi:hypothetical protein
MTNLDNLLNDFNQRKKQELNATAQKGVEADKLRSVFLNILHEKISPILRDLAGKITTKGHSASVKENFDNMLYPSVTFSFTPTLPNPPAYTPPSTLRFAYTEADSIEISQTITGNSRSQALHNINIGPSTVSEDVIRSQVLAFISAALNAN